MSVLPCLESCSPRRETHKESSCIWHADLFPRRDHWLQRAALWAGDPAAADSASLSLSIRVSWKAWTPLTVCLWPRHHKQAGLPARSPNFVIAAWMAECIALLFSVLGGGARRNYCCCLSLRKTMFPQSSPKANPSFVWAKSLARKVSELSRNGM